MSNTTIGEHKKIPNTCLVFSIKFYKDDNGNGWFPCIHESQTEDYQV